MRDENIAEPGEENRRTKALRKRAASEWLTRPAPELTIVDAELWQRVQARLQTTNATFLHGPRTFAGS